MMDDLDVPAADPRKTFETLLVTLATNAVSSTDAAAKAVHEQRFDEFVQRSKIVNLIPAISILLKSRQVSARVNAKLMSALVLLPLRPDGVRATLEFVFATHASSTSASARKDGADITPEALAMATKLLARPPASVDASMWFESIVPQLLVFLDGEQGSELVKVAAYVLGFGILGNRQHGSPGTAGWNAFHRHVLRAIKYTWPDTESHSALTSEKASDIIDVRATTLIDASTLRLALSRLRSLLMSHPNAPLTRRLVSTVFVQLWSIISWPDPSAGCKRDYCEPAREILEVYLRLSPISKIRILVEHLLYKGETELGGWWNFEVRQDGNLQVIGSSKTKIEDREDVNWSQLDVIDSKVEVLIALMRVSTSEEDIVSLFLDLFESLTASKDAAAEVQILQRDAKREEHSLMQVIEAKLLQRMMEGMPDAIGSRPTAVLKLADQILQSAGNDDEQVSLALSLTNLVISSPGFAIHQVSQGLMANIKQSLRIVGGSHTTDQATTADNLLFLLQYLEAPKDPTESPQQLTSQQAEDRKVYNLGLQYVQQIDSPLPVRAEGLSMIQKLIVSRSAVLDVPAMLVLLASLLKEDEDYINIRVIKMYIQLADMHPKSVIKDLLENFLDSNELSKIDVRLRTSEALSQVIERLGETFSGDMVHRVAEALLITAGRRSHRSKTARRQDRKAKLQQLKKRKASDAMGGVELPDPDDDLSESEKQTNEILAQIVSGWESKRGSEDIRIRTSALSTFAVGIETNIAGLGAALVSTGVDLALNILTAESSVEAGILRRAAIWLIFTFIKALDDAREAGRKLGFGLSQASQADIKRVLQHVAATDDDGLVKSQALDALDSLEALQVNDLAALVDAQSPSGAVLTKLAGLQVGLPGRGENGIQRPKIEEVD